jgi:uncharacterized protein YndB with AHSA1/START domain
MQDEIRRELTINASQERLYAAISSAEELVKWFPETIEGSMEPGSEPVFGFGEHGSGKVLIVDARPHDYFAYRWIPGGNPFKGEFNEANTTLVEFHIKDNGDGSCQLTLTESGFSTLPEDFIEAAYKDNSGGWEFMLERLQSYIGKAAA